MAAKTSRPPVNPSPKSVATLIRDAIERNGYKDVKDCARNIKVPYDLFNKVVGGHLPKDAQLLEYAKKLNLDPRELILAAYREKAPEDMKPYFNSVALLDGHSATVREIMELTDACNADQLRELQSVARLIRSKPRDSCRKALALLALYQELDPDVMEHMDSLIVLALRSTATPELKGFKDAIAALQVSRAGRRGRLRV
jgi:hypothetical protein